MEEKPIKIAVFRCRKSADYCTGASCFRAFWDRKATFRRYEGQNVEFSALFDCSGCEKQPWREQDPGFVEKLDRLTEEGITVVHTGICLSGYYNRQGEFVKRCPHYDELVAILERRGLTVVEGSH